MLHLEEAFTWFAANPLGGRIGTDQLRILDFHFFELIHEPVELRVRDLGIVEHVIAVLVVADFLSERFDLLFDSPRRSSHHQKIIFGSGASWGVVSLPTRSSECTAGCQ